MMMVFSRTTVRSSILLTSGSKNSWLVERLVTVGTRGQPSQADMPST